jgi:colanic acid biosynthesis glycosyl transferase WcaI
LYTNAGANLPPLENLHGVSIHRVPTTRYGRIGLIGRFVDYASFYISAGLTLLRLLKAGDIGVAETDPPLISITVAFCARAKRATHVNWQQDVFPEVATHLAATPLPPWFDEMLRKLRDWSMRGAATNVMISQRMLEYFEQRGIPRSRLCVIENWSDAAAITPKPTEASALRARLGLVGKFVVCYSGNLGRAHEFDTLVGAALLLRSDTPVVFLIIGGGAKMDSLRHAVTTRGLDNFQFLPYQPRAALEDSLAAGDVHLASLLPALEGLILPSKLYGILAAGRPLIFIGDPDGDVGRVIAEAQCGVTVAVHNSTELAAAITRLQSDPAMCVAMGVRARDLLLDRYAMGRAVERWFAVLALITEGCCVAALPPLP